MVLTALLKKGMPYSSKTPERYLSPKDAAMNTYLAVKKKQQEQHLKIEGKMRELEYKDWLSNLSQIALLKFTFESDFADLPKKIRKTMRKRKALECAKKYFNAEIWPIKKKN